MAPSRLKIIDSQIKKPISAQEIRLNLKREWDRVWEFNPSSQNPYNRSREKIRMNRSRDMIKSILPTLKGKEALDVGCGTGWASKFLATQGFQVDATDFSSFALHHVNPSNHAIRLLQESFPFTRLKDFAYDLVVAFDVVAELPVLDRRLFFSELSRVMNRQARVIVSTPLDLKSEDALLRFIQLFQTEFELEDVILSHMGWVIRLEKLTKNLFFKSFERWLRKSERLNHLLELLGRTLRQDRTLSHAILVGSKKPINSKL